MGQPGWLPLELPEFLKAKPEICANPEIEQTTAFVLVERQRTLVDAWSLDTTGTPPWTVHAAADGEVVAAETRIGDGRCVALGDARFLEDENLEGEYDFQRANIEFLERLLEGTASGTGSVS